MDRPSYRGWMAISFFSGSGRRRICEFDPWDVWNDEWVEWIKIELEKNRLYRRGEEDIIFLLLSGNPDNMILTTFSDFSSLGWLKCSLCYLHLLLRRLDCSAVITMLDSFYFSVPFNCWFHHDSHNFHGHNFSFFSTCNIVIKAWLDSVPENVNKFVWRSLLLLGIPTIIFFCSPDFEKYLTNRDDISGER